MAINPYFNFYTATNEQSLLENLIIESIRAYGFNTWYMPKTLNSMDDIFRESEINSFNSAIEIECYLKSNMKFEGDGKFMSQHLGLEIRDQTTFTVAQTVFKDQTDLLRPQEGDLMFLPLDGKIYEIKFVEHQDVFYQLGRLMVWDIQCEVLEYTGQRFDTGVAAIDAIASDFAMDDVEDSPIDDWIDQSPEIQEESDDTVDFSDIDPFSGGNI